MERRNFLKSAILLTAGAGAISGGLAACNDETEKKTEPQQPSAKPSTPTAQKRYERPPVKVLKELDNEYLHVILYSDATAQITDKRNDFIWNIGSVAIQDESPIEEYHLWTRKERSFTEQYPARFIGTQNGNNLEFIILGYQNIYKGRFVCSVSLDGEWLSYRMLEFSGNFHSLVFPPPVLSDELVVPQGIGRLINKDKPDIYSREFLSLYNHLNMKWIGGLVGDHAWLGVFDNDTVDAGAMLVNAQIAPGWLPCLGKWSGNYGIRYKFIKGGYVDIAKTYRQLLIANGSFITLNEKTKISSDLKSLKGGRMFSFVEAMPETQVADAQSLWFNDCQIEASPTNKMKVNFTHKQVADLLNHYQKAGYKKGLYKIMGWIDRGLDASHPDIWPPNARLGTIEELNKLLSGNNLVSCLHDNYQDIYETTPSFPLGVNRKPDGSPMFGELLAGGLAYILNSDASQQYAHRNWQYIKDLNPKSIFIDTTAASRLLESFDDSGNQTRMADQQRKFNLLKFFKDQGCMVGSSGGAEYTIPVVDWYENNYARTKGESIPLWPLVFHDTAYTFRNNTFVDDKPYPKWMEDMLWGNMLMFNMHTKTNQVTKTQPAYGASFTERDFTRTSVVDNWHDKIGNAEMIEHRFLDPDQNVEQTIFASGESIICNFGNKAFIAHGRLIQAYSYAIVR
jgi:hypothetical protein